MAPEQEVAEVRQMVQSLDQFASIALPPNLDVNESVAQVFGLMFNETRNCSEAFVWAPTPPGGRASIVWLAMQLGKGVFNSCRSRLSYSCARAAIYNWNTQLDMASRGLVFGRVPAWA